MEHSLHWFPFFRGTHSGSGLLEDSHVFLPFLLAGKSIQACHCCVPVEVNGSFDNHKQACAKNIDFHFEDAYFPDTCKDFRPCLRLTMSFPIFGNQLRRIA